MGNFIKSAGHPIGFVTDSVTRIEFQAQGSPHAHTLQWVKDAPKIGYSSKKDVQEFIDRYITCSISENDDTLKDLVQSLQIHNHPPICRRKGKCRFNYPKPPSPQTIVSGEPIENIQLQIEFATNIAASVKEVLESEDLPENATLQEVLSKANVTIDYYIKALSISKCGRSIILKRKPCEQKAWGANIDMQFNVNAYACVMYVASYVLKAEKGMGELLKQAALEIEKEEIRTQLRKL